MAWAVAIISSETCSVGAFRRSSSNMWSSGGSIFVDQPDFVFLAEHSFGSPIKPQEAGWGRAQPQLGFVAGCNADQFPPSPPYFCLGSIVNIKSEAVPVRTSARYNGP